MIGSDGQMVHVMTSPKVVSYKILDDWSVEKLLLYVARSQPPFHALIDTGALITGLTNLQVAKFLLDHGLKDLDGVVFLDRQDNPK